MLVNQHRLKPAEEGAAVPMPPPLSFSVSQIFPTAMSFGWTLVLLLPFSEPSYFIKIAKKPRKTESLLGL